MQERPSQGQVAFLNLVHAGNEYRAVWARQEFGAGILNVVVATASHYTYHEMWEFLRFMLVLGASLIAASAVLVVFGVQWALGPVAAAAEQLDNIRQPNVAKVLFENRKTPKELRPFIRALTEMLNRLNLVLERQKRFTADAAHELHTPLAVAVWGNLDELIRLFNNVLDNAARYGPSGGTLRITLKCEPDEYVAVHVHDEGGNIPPEALPHLFDRFYRVEQSRSSSAGGTGLGLAIAREVAHRHHGDISITSEPKSGTLVCIRLPRTPPISHRLLEKTFST